MECNRIYLDKLRRTLRIAIMALDNYFCRFPTLVFRSLRGKLASSARLSQQNSTIVFLTCGEKLVVIIMILKSALVLILSCFI